MDRLRVRMHLDLCRGCLRYVRQMSATLAALGMMPLPEPSPHLEQELHRRFEGWKQSRGP